MSTGAECEFVQVRSDAWYYLLERMPFEGEQRWGHWLEDADCYGPFATFDAAKQHLDDNHCNPGGFWTRQLPDGVAELNLSDDPVLKDRIEVAEKPASSRRSYGRMRW